MNQFKLSTRIATALALSAAMVAAGVQAGEKAPQPSKPAISSSQANAKAKEFMQARTRMQQLEEKLQTVQRKAVKNNSDLQKQRQDLQNLLVKTMKKQGFDPTASMNRMSDLRHKLQAKNVPNKKKRELVSKYRAEQSAFMKARKKALNDGAVSKAREAYKNKLLLAMNKVEPKTKDMLKQLEHLEAKVRAMYQQSQQRKAPGGESR